MLVLGASRVVLRNVAIRKASRIASIPVFHHTDNVLTNSTSLQLIAELPENVEISSTNAMKCLVDSCGAGEFCMLSLGVAYQRCISPTRTHWRRVCLAMRIYELSISCAGPDSFIPPAYSPLLNLLAPWAFLVHEGRPADGELRRQRSA